MKTLIVEDDKICRNLLRSILGGYGVCDMACDGVAALTFFKKAHHDKAPYELICLDILMPNSDGHEVLEEIRALEAESSSQIKPVSILILTGLQDEETMARATRNGCNGFVSKPLDRKVLLDTIQRLGLVAPLHA